MISLLQQEIHEKGWGEEVWIVNNEKYCLKILQFYTGGKCSMHLHPLKTETWYIEYGRFRLHTINTENGQILTKDLESGDIVHVPDHTPHQLEAISRGSIIEVSTPHYESDSLRLSPGDSQK